MEKSGKYKLDRNNTSFTLQLFEHFKNTTWEKEYGFLKYYQNVVRSFVNSVDLDSRGLLIYQTMGLGKSILAVSIAMDLMKERQPIILLTKSLQENMRGAIKKYISLRKEHEPDYHLGRLSPHELDVWIDKNYSFVSMNASNMLKQIGKAAEGHSTEEFDAALEKKFGEVLKLMSLDRKLLIVDEAHNFFRAITNGSKNAIGLYDMIMKAKDLKVMFFTGTPIANDPFELVPCFNMIGSKHGKPIFPEDYKDFNKLFIDSNGKIKNKEKFQNRIMGLVSHVSHLSKPGAAFGINDPSTRAEFPEELPTVIERVPMDPDQYVMYGSARDKEREEGKRGGPGNRIVDLPALTKPKNKAASTYRVASRQLSNFCPPSGHRAEKDPSKIPTVYLTSPKFRKIHENINKHNNQLGIVYSQFVGVGGIGAFKGFLNNNNWEELKVSPVKLHSAKEKINKLEKTDVGEQGELDEYTEGATKYIGDVYGLKKLQEEEKHTKEIYAEDKYTKETYIEDKYTGSAIPPVDDLLAHIEAEANKLNTHAWWTGGDETDCSRIADSDEYSDSEDDLFDINSVMVGSEDSNEDPNEIPNEDPNENIKYTFKYATDEEIKKLLGSGFNKPNEYIIIVFANGEQVGYIRVEYREQNNEKQNNEKQNNGEQNNGEQNIKYKAVIINYHFNKLVPEDIIIKLTNDAINMRQGGIKEINGGSVDTSGAVPAQRPNRKRFYAVISGDIPVEARSKIQEMFNDEANSHGGILDLIILSSTGAEGLDLKNARHVHIMEPYWNWGRIKQIIARAVRNDSHKQLPQDEKNVTPYIYLAVPPESERLPNGEYPATTDTELYTESIINQTLIELFHEALREVCIECLVNDEDYCRMCGPTNQKLFTDNIFRDINAADPCTEMQEAQVKAEEIIVDGEKFYYAKDENSIYDYKIFIYDEKINGYRPMKESDPRYAKIVDAIQLKDN